MPSDPHLEDDLCRAAAEEGLRNASSVPLRGALAMTG